jgi:hypothetical protein
MCPSCGSKDLTWDAKPTYYDNPEGTKGMWQITKCRSCTKKWNVSWNEELVDFGDKIFVVKYQRKIKNPTEFLNYVALHKQQTGHTGMMFSEVGKK